MALYELDGHARRRSRPTAATGCADNATVIGKVDLREDVSVWFGARDARRQRADPHRRAHQHPGRLRAAHRPGLSADHRGGLHDRPYGDAARLHDRHAAALIGIGAIVLNGARIGAGCLVGAGALVPEGQGDPGRLGGDGLARQGRPRRSTDAGPGAHSRGAWSSTSKRWQRYAALKLRARKPI